MKLFGRYTNGNYDVLIYDDGTKIRYNDLNYFNPEFPESIDVKISDRCDMGCLFCHECSTPDGKLANLNHPIFDSIHPYTELALGGGNIFEHPDLIPFLEKMRDKKVICNITVHLHHYMEHFDQIKELIAAKLVHGVGVSVNGRINTVELEHLRYLNDHVVVHSIAGVVPLHVLDYLSDYVHKLLILGYKEFGRGETYISNNPDVLYNIHRLKESLPKLKQMFHVVAFDNLAIKQLQPQLLITCTEWEHLYMGEDGQYTMYLDMVKEEYAISSTSKRSPITSNNINDLFKEILFRNFIAV